MCNPCMAPEPLPAGQIAEDLWEKWLGPRRRSDAQTHPGLFRRRWPIKRGWGDNQLFRELKKSRRTRLISAARYGKNQRKQREHLEDIFGEERPKVKNSSGKYKRVFEHYQKIADAFGLVLTPLLPTRTQTTPKVCPSCFTVQTLNRTRWIRSSANRKGNQNKGPTRPVVGEIPVPPQPHSSERRQPQAPSRWAIRQVLEHQGSYQTIALPTGYGKTRIGSRTCYGKKSRALP